MIEKNIYKKISKYKNIVIARHIGPDPDALGAQIALRDSIKLTFPKKNVYAVGTPVARFKYFGSLDRVNELSLDKALLIVVDVPNIDRIDGVTISNFDDVIKIDHHPYEDKMGTIEYIDENSSSACEMVANVIINSKLRMNKQIAESIYLGLTADSDRFLLSTTGSKTFDVASYLIKKYKLDLKKLYNYLYERPLNEIRFQSYIALNLTVTENGFAYIKLNNDVFTEYNVDSGTASNMVNNFNFIKEIIAWAFVSYDEKTEIYKVNIRSRGPIINEVASKYRGGGHKYASGARIKNIDEVDELIRELDNACLEYRQELDNELE